MAKWQRMWDIPDNQEVGLEAAILERVRNSSLVKKSRADNVTGLSHVPKLRLRATYAKAGTRGRGALICEQSGGVTQPWTRVK
jgi:hypothetical protein